MSTTITTTFTLTREAFSSIIEMAGYGVGYWASAMRSVQSDIPWEGLPGFFYFEACHFTEGGTGKKFLVTMAQMEQAAVDLFTKRTMNQYYMDAIDSLIHTGETGDVGSDIADALVQQACFGDVLYG